jgi:hypothetical protein
VFSHILKGGRFNRRGQRKGGQFRDNYAYGSDAHPAVEKLFRHKGFAQAARDMWAEKLGDSIIVEPQVSCLY